MTEVSLVPCTCYGGSIAGCPRHDPQEYTAVKRVTAEHGTPSLAEDLKVVRDTLRANGVYRYGNYERKNTYGALESLKRVETALNDLLGAMGA